MTKEEQRRKGAESAARWRRNNPEAYKASMARFRDRHREKLRARDRDKYWKNPEAHLAKVRAWKKKNRQRVSEYNRRYLEAHRESSRKRNSAWQKRNLHAAAFRNHRFRARKKSQLHPESDRAIEKAFYQAAKELTKATGIEHNVDHIIPLASGGWHHHLNLQVLPYVVNASKNDNPFWEHPYFKTWRDVPSWLWPERLAKEYRAKIIRKAA